MKQGTRQRVGVIAAVAVTLWLGGCDRPDDIATPVVEMPGGDGPRAPVEVAEPPTLGLLQVGVDEQGRPVRVACMTCHSVRDSYDPPMNDDIRGLRNVHAGMVYRHGALSCRSCHDPERADRLRLANGRTIELADSIQLCAQCHGPQVRDWEAGSHGGRRGHWDRRRGPAVRNHCLDCHDAHDPAFPTYRPLPPTRDRFVSVGEHAEEDHDG